MSNEYLSCTTKSVEEYNARLAAAEADNKRLREALNNFTFPASDRIGDEHLDDDYLITAAIPMREIRQARAALEGRDD